MEVVDLSMSGKTIQNVVQSSVVLVKEIRWLLYDQSQQELYVFSHMGREFYESIWSLVVHR